MLERRLVKARAIGEALSVLLVAVVGEPSDGAAIGKRGAADRCAAFLDRIGGCVERDRVQGGGDGEVAWKSLENEAVGVFKYPEEAKPAPSWVAEVARDARYEPNSPNVGDWVYNRRRPI
jgi:hypothetical protein